MASVASDGESSCPNLSEVAGRMARNTRPLGVSLE